jgi:hypothetical protein
MAQSTNTAEKTDKNQKIALLKVLCPFKSAKGFDSV